MNALRRRPPVLTVGDVVGTSQVAGQLAKGPEPVQGANQLGDVAGTSQVAGQLAEGLEPVQGANQLGDVARVGQLASQLVGGSKTGTEADPLGDGNGRPGFDSVQFWLMLFQAGYEPWRLQTTG